jgi:hypothetical protein
MLHVRSGLGFQEEEERRKTFNERALQICAKKRERKHVPHDEHCSWNAVRLVGALFLSAHMTTSARSPNEAPAFFVGISTSRISSLSSKKAKIENEWRRRAGTPRRRAWWLSQLYKTGEIRRSL